MDEFEFDLYEMVKHFFFKERKLKIIERLKVNNSEGTRYKYRCVHAREKKGKGAMVSGASIVLEESDLRKV